MSLTRKDRPRVLVISSLVSGSRVGGGLTAAVLEARGVRADLVPTVIMGRHPGLGAPGGGPIAADWIASALAAMVEQGIVETADAIFTGYFREPDQVEAVARFVAAAKARRPDLTVMVDPILGDGSDASGEGRLYIAEATAAAIRDRLVPLADIITPNRFELAWLAGERDWRLPDAEAAERALGLAPAALVTSSAAEPGRIGALAVGPDSAFRVETARAERAPNGTGDFFAAWALAEHLDGRGWTEAAASAAAMTALLVERTAGGSDLVAPPLGAPAPPPLQPRRLGAARPAFVLGLDGAPGGWAGVLLDLNGIAAPQARLYPDFAAALAEPVQIIGVDMPIGFEDAPSGPGGRACERLARGRLGPRRSSVFSAPLRPALSAPDYSAALAANRAAGGPGLSKQCWNLFAKLREVDARMRPELEGVVFEVHPELVATVLAGAPARHAKRTPEGRAERLALLVREGLSGALFEPHPFPRKLCAPDDLVDAGLCALGARRIAAGAALALPDDPPRDGRGLRMAIFA